MTPRRRRPAAGRAAAHAGFTLVEVLVTVLIMSGLLITIAQILTAARNTRDSIHNMHEAYLAGPAILDLIERDLRALHTLNRDPGTWLRVRDRVIAGLDADAIDFVTTTDGLVIHEQQGERRFVRADVNEAGYHLRLNPAYDDFLEIWRREDFGVDEEPFDGGRWSFLHDRVKGLQIEVYEEDGPEAEPLESWGTEQDEGVGLPARLELELVLEIAPRLVRDTLVPIRRTEVHRRTIRFPEPLRASAEVQPVYAIPEVPEPTPDDGTQGGAAGFDAAGPGGGGGGGGGAGSGFGDLPGGG